ncbi:hypothetical protein [Compostimonas suwonensis]|nr:hypothetical protein [Compostimonas suwonensis]
MGIRRLAGAAVTAAALVVGISGCTAGAPDVDPVVVDVAELQGTTVEVPLNSTLVIVTELSDVDSYTADIDDPAIAEFARGAKTGEVSYRPVLTPKQVGESEVTLSNEDTGSQDVEFTLEVTPIAVG